MSEKDLTKESFVPFVNELYNQESQDSLESSKLETLPLDTEASHFEQRRSSFEKNKRRFQRRLAQKRPDFQLNLSSQHHRDPISSNERERITLIADKEDLFKYMFDLINGNEVEPEAPGDLDFLEFKDCVVKEEVFPFLNSTMKILKLRSCGVGDSLARQLVQREFVMLTKLDLTDNKLTEIPRVNAPNLIALSLSLNSISKFDVNNFDKMANLQDLDLSDNLLNFQIKAFKELMMDTNSSLAQLSKLNLEGNPLCETVDIYEKVILLEMYDKLEFLNNAPVDREAFSQKYNQVKKEVYAREIKQDKNLNLATIQLPYHFPHLTELISSCQDMPNQLLNYLNNLKDIVEALVQKSQKNSFIFKYEIRNNENSLQKDIEDFLKRVEIMMEQDQHSNSFMFDILAKMTLLRQENIDISIFIFDKLLSLMERSEEYRDSIVLSIKNECLHSFCPENLHRLEFPKLSRLNQIIALTKSINELMDRKFQNRIEKWLEQIIEAELCLNIELKDYLILSDFFCLNLCLKIPSKKFVRKMEQLFECLMSKLKYSEESDQEIVSVFIFFFKVTKIWMKIENIRADKTSLEFPDPRKLHKGGSFNSKLGTPTPQSETSSPSLPDLERQVTKYGFYKKFFLLKDATFEKFIRHIWIFYNQIKDSETKFYDNLQQRLYLEILNCMLTILSELLKYSKFVSLEVDVYNFQGGSNLFTQIFSVVNEKIKNLEFRTIVYNFAFKIFNNK